jgi:hypothetical protein
MEMSLEGTVEAAQLGSERYGVIMVCITGKEFDLKVRVSIKLLFKMSSNDFKHKQLCQISQN